jgi:fluoroquinolone transport system ATP-binding protein
MIRVADLSFTYPKATKPAIEGLGFEVERGEIFGFLGPSGAGKSTTQRILIGLLRQYQGSVSVFDRRLSEWGSDYYERIGVSFEFPTHFLKLSALENLRYFGRLYRTQARTPPELLELVGLRDDGNMLVSQYSKGMKNRLSVARALLHDPELLFMDEPTVGLDPGNARRIKSLISSQKEAGKTVFLTTHDMTVADELCDRVAFIVDGRIEIVERPRELKLRYGHATVRIEYRSADNIEASEFAMTNLADNSDFLNLLRTKELRTMHSQEASLEDVFIRVTGRGLQ